MDEMSIEELCEYRQAVSRQLKSLEEERKSIDDEIMDYLSEAELKRGVNLKNGSLLKMRSRTNWEYPTEVSEQVSSLRRFSRECGEAFSSTTHYLVIT